MEASAPDTSGHRDEIRKRRLMICLDAVDNALKASSSLDARSQSQSKFLKNVRTNFGNISLMKDLWVHKDPLIRMTACSICALLARHLIHKEPLEKSESEWLKVMEELPGMKSIALGDHWHDSGLMDGYVYGVLSLQSKALSFARVTCFTETLAIFMGLELANNQPSRPSLDNQAKPIKEKFATHVTSLVKRMKEERDKGNKGYDNVVHQLNRIFGCLLSDGCYIGP